MVDRITEASNIPNPSESKPLTCEPMVINAFDLENIFLKGLIEYVRSFCNLHSPELKNFFESQDIKFRVETGKVVPYRDMTDDTDRFILEFPRVDPQYVQGILSWEVERLDSRGEIEYIQFQIERIASNSALDPKDKKALDILIKAMDGSEEAKWQVESLQYRQPIMAPYLYDAIVALYRDEDQQFGTEKTWFELICFNRVEGGAANKATQIYRWARSNTSAPGSTDEFARTITYDEDGTENVLLPRSECILFYYFHAKANSYNPVPAFTENCGYPPHFWEGYWEDNAGIEE